MLQDLWIVTRTCLGSGVQENSKSDAGTVRHDMVPTLHVLLTTFQLTAGSYHAAASALLQVAVWKPMHAIMLCRLQQAVNIKGCDKGSCLTSSVPIHDSGQARQQIADASYLRDQARLSLSHLAQECGPV